VNIPSQILTLLAGILLTLISLWYGQNHNLLPAAAAQVAPAIDNLFGAMLTIGTGIFLLVNGVLIYSAIRYRRQPGDDTDGPNVHGNIPLEILWTAIPAIIVLAISVYSFDIYSNESGMSSMDHAMGHSKHQVASRSGAALAATLVAQDDPNQQAKDSPVLSSPRIGDPSQPAQLVVNAAGMQYAWLFTYPGTEVVAGELHLPVGREVLMNISANDVLHAFWVPEFRLKQDAIPGRESQIRFVPTLEGDYPVICAELCGAYHGAMKTHVVVESEESFQNWLTSQVALAKSETRVAINPAEMTNEQYLAPYAKELGVTAETLSSLHSHS
jgi:cytochrome c oxidase subunit II